MMVRANLLKLRRYKPAALVWMLRYSDFFCATANFFGATANLLAVFLQFCRHCWTSQQWHLLTINTLPQKSRPIVLCGLCGLGCAWTLPLNGDVVYMTDGQQVFGRVVSEEADRIVFDQRVDTTSGFRQRTILRSDMVTFVLTVQKGQLEELNPGQPRAYRDLAEELAVRRRDPEARDLAIRLFLLAAWHGDRQLQESSFAGLVQLARTPLEERKFRALASLTFGGAGDWLKPVATEIRDDTNRTDEIAGQREQLLVAIRQLRRGDRSEASNVLGQSWIEEAIRPFDRVCTWREFRSCAGESSLNTRQLAKLLELEILLGNPNRDSSKPLPADWAAFASRAETGRSVETIQPVSFENVSEFDLSENAFRDNHWVESGE